MNMRRADFIKIVTGMAVGPFIPQSSRANTSEKLFAHDEIFEVWPRNDRLVYFRKDSPVYKYLENQLSGRIVVRERFRHYSPKRDFILLKKDYYTIEDFAPLVALLNGRYERRCQYSEYGAGNTFLRMIYEKDNNSYYPDLFEAGISE
jgi:hypothetical protein